LPFIAEVFGKQKGRLVNQDFKGLTEAVFWVAAVEHLLHFSDYVYGKVWVLSFVLLPVVVGLEDASDGGLVWRLPFLRLSRVTAKIRKR